MDQALYLIFWNLGPYVEKPPAYEVYIPSHAAIYNLDLLAEFWRYYLTCSSNSNEMIVLHDIIFNRKPC